MDGAVCWYWMAVEDGKDCVVAGDWLGHVLLGQCHCSQLLKLCDTVVIVMAVECKVYRDGGRSYKCGLRDACDGGGGMYADLLLLA